MTNKLRVCVIGGGIFGLTAAIYLSKFSSEIKIFDKNQTILNGATRFNHNRHHFGYHYPRSIDTAVQCINARKDFDKFYRNSIDYSFKNFYAISKVNSKISYKKFENFCKKVSLKFKNIEAPKNIFNTSLISKCYIVNEGVYDFNKIKSILSNRIKKYKNIKLVNKVKVVGFVDQTRTIEYLRSNKLVKENFDLIINATYESINDHIFKDKIDMEYNLQEMCKLNIKTKKFGSTILDGEFPSILPIANKKNEYLFAHVKHSQLIKIKSKKIPKNIFNKKIPSQINHTFEKSKKFMKILDKAKLIGSFRVVRAVNIDKKTDSRKSEIIIHKNGNLSIFSGKIITVETIGKEISNILGSNY